MIQHLIADFSSFSLSLVRHVKQEKFHTHRASDRWAVANTLAGFFLLLSVNNIKAEVVYLTVAFHALMKDAVE